MQSSGGPPPAGRAGAAVCVAAPAIDGSLSVCSPIHLPEQGGVGDQALAVGRIPDVRRESTGVDNQAVDLHEPCPWVICQQLPAAEGRVADTKFQGIASEPAHQFAAQTRVALVEVLGAEFVG